MVNVTSPPPPPAPKFKILSWSCPSSVQLGQRARFSASVQNTGNGTGDLRFWFRNEASSPGYVTVIDPSTNYPWFTLNPGAENTARAWVGVEPGGVRSCDFDLEFSTTGSFSLTFSVGHDTTKDDSVSFGCPEGEEAQREAERYASM
jgi:hypothetical protein